MTGAIVSALIGVSAIVGIVLLGFLARGAIGSGVRIKDFEAVKAQRNLAYDAIEKISAACEEYKEIDHPLASKLTPLISDFKKAEWELRK